VAVRAVRFCEEYDLWWAGRRRCWPFGGTVIAARILVAGVGNVFLGDDAFGVEVVRALAGRRMPDGVRVVDFGIRGLDLAYAMLDGYDAMILVDAVRRGGSAGTVRVLEVDPPRPEEPGATDLTVEGHNLDPARVLRLAAAMGSPVQRLFVVGCEPGPLDELDEMAAGLSEPVRAAVGEAVVLVEALVRQISVRVG
jgi:hydrogenase maturation protease